MIKEKLFKKEDESNIELRSASLLMIEMISFMQNITPAIEGIKCVPLTVYETMNGTYVAKNDALWNESVDIGTCDDGKTGIVVATSLRNETVKIYCCSKSFSQHLNIITAYMGFPFNGQMKVNSPRGTRYLEECPEFLFLHYGELHKFMSAKDKMRESNIEKAVNEMLEIHRLAVRMDTLTPIKANYIRDIYRKLVSCAINARDNTMLPSIN